MDYVWRAADVLTWIAGELADMVGGVPLMVWLMCAALFVGGLLRHLLDGPV